VLWQLRDKEGGTAVRSTLATRRWWSRRHVIIAQLVGVPLLVTFCLIVQWPLWTTGKLGLASANLLVAVTFYATSVFVYAEPGHRLTGLGLAAAAVLWPVNWINEWNVSPLPLVAALEGPLASLLAVWALLRYPAPWPRRQYEAAAIAIGVLAQIAACLQVVTALPQAHPDTFWLSWWPGKHAYAVSVAIYDYGIIVITVAAVLTLAIRLARLAGPDREVMRPVLLAIILAGILTAAGGLAAAADVRVPTLDQLYTLETISLVGVPVAFLIASARRWLARESMPGLIRELDASPTPAHAQSALRRALDDPSLRLLYRIGGVYVDISGIPQPVPLPDDPRVVTAVPPTAATPDVLIVASPLLARYQAVVHTAARAATLALENTRLQAEVRAHIHQVAESAQRLAAAVDAEHRSIQDTVQRIRDGELAELSARLDPLEHEGITKDLADHLRSARAWLGRAELELGRLAEGIEPAELTLLGLAESVSAAARRLSPRITVAVTQETLNTKAQVAAYFILSELMTNVAKHAAGSSASVAAAVEGCDLILEVTDDGPGGADPSGSGLRGLAERVSDLSGSLSITSAPGCGTRVTVRLPI
jgi:signal transduction histidine kinase